MPDQNTEIPAPAPARVHRETREWANSRFSDLDEERRELLVMVVDQANGRAEAAEGVAADANARAASSQRWVYGLAIATLLFALSATALVLDRSFGFTASADGVEGQVGGGG